jgi:mono/diheme cytochrome c family protein
MIVPMWRPMAFALALLTLVPACARQRSNETAAQTASAQASILRTNPASASDGGSIYIANCSSCHQTNGQGLPGEFPPLDRNPVVTGDASTVIIIVKLGMSGKRYINNLEYDGTMPAWGQLLSNRDIAAVVSYIRTSWHNVAAPVSVADVEAATR